MTENHISITAALSDAWDRMQTILFRPFDLKKWMVLGFTAWLAGLAQGGKSFSWNVGGGADSNESEAWAASSRSAARAELEPASLGVETRIDWPDWDHWGRWPLEHPLWFTVGVLGCAFLLVLFVVILWLSSRGKFMFLDNVVHKRALVVDPWKRFKRQGDSLFLFRIGFFLACVLLFGGVALLIAATVGFSALSDLETAPAIALVVVAVGFLLVLAVVTLYAAFFLNAFVIPLMHRYNLGAVAACSRFLDILRQHPSAFVLCGLLVIAFGIGILILVVGFGLMTCCLGFLLLMIPYISSVLVLPISLFYRSFTFEFLAQCDSGLLPESTSEDAPPESPPPVAEATV